MSTSFAAVPNVVVVDPQFDAYKQLADSARLGRISLHLRSSGADALKLASRGTVDAWLIAADLDDMSGHDLVELLRTRSGEAKVAMVEGDGVVGRQHAVAEQHSIAADADALLSQPITLRDLEELLGLPVEERSKVITASGMARLFVAVPTRVKAAAVSLAILLMQ